MKSIQYPHTRREEVVDELFGEKIIDQYRWLEDTDNKDVRKWLDEQNELSRSILDSVDGRKELEDEFWKLFEKESLSIVCVKQNRHFIFKHSGKLNHPVLYYSDGDFNPTDAHLAINPNKFSKDGTVAMDWFFPSHDGRYIAYGKSKSGSEASILHILDLKTGKHLSDKIPDMKWASVAWLKDNSGFYYGKNTGGKKFVPNIYFHKLGNDIKKDKFIFGKKLPETYMPFVIESEDGKYLFLIVETSFGSNDLYVKNLESGSDFIPVAVGKNAIFTPEIFDDKLYILTDYGAPKRKIVVTDAANPKIEKCHDIIPEGEGVIQNFSIVGGKLVVRITQDTYSRILIYALDGKLQWEIPLPIKGTASCLPRSNQDTVMFLYFQSFFYPVTIFRVDIDEHSIDKIYQFDVDDFDPDDFEMRLDFYESKDGTKIPIYVMHKKDIELDGSNPTILTGYGGFAAGMVPLFNMMFLPWLKRGGVFARAGIRGGDEYGKEWHEAGMKANKQNVFDDFIWAVMYLLSAEYARSDALAIYGGSNGGLLVGTALTQAPQLFRAVICTVPLLDMLRYHKFGVAHIWTSEYGNPDTEKDFQYIRKYSPYQQLHDNAKYPAVLFRTAEFDGRVHPMHAMKMAAKMQSSASTDRPVLLFVEPKAGHGAGMPLYKAIQYSADIIAFAAQQLKKKL